MHFSIPETATIAKNADIAIIGSGLSGAATAYNLVLRGYKVTVFEQAAKVASGASGNHQGILYNSWGSQLSPSLELAIAGYQYTQKLIDQLPVAAVDFKRSGIIQLAYNLKTQLRQEKLIKNTTNFPDNFFKVLNHRQIEELANCQLSQDLTGLFFPDGLWLNPLSLIKQLLISANINVILNCHIDKLIHTDNGWQLYSENYSNQQHLSTTFAAVVICNAYEAQSFTQTKDLPLIKIRGQLSLVKMPSPLNLPLCTGGYILPNYQDFFAIGASFKFNDSSLAVRDNEHLENLAHFSEILPNLINQIDVTNLSAMVNYRTTTPDYWPLVGPVADFKQFIMDFARLRLDAKAKITSPCPYYPNLYLNLAHGAKGLLTAPLGGEIIANYITNQTDKIPRQFLNIVHPNRFYYRDLTRGKI